MEKIISHRGNIFGPNPRKENNLDYIESAINGGYDVEVDVWADSFDIITSQLWLGHDNPTFKVDIRWLYDKIDYIWIHCKNLNALNFFSLYEAGFNYFWHQTDDYTLTSRGYTIVYPGNSPHSKAVMVELYDSSIDKGDLELAYGVITDTPILYKNLYKK